MYTFPADHADDVIQLLELDFPCLGGNNQSLILEGFPLFVGWVGICFFSDLVDLYVIRKRILSFTKFR